ncbi:hypothetical protein LUW74_13505 [Actinomadura madurae]|nr:hypothetical protein [Actinomadura madurae]URN04229.1 hypothetical protein LUW74_13505 [Actinomadura madurae]
MYAGVPTARLLTALAASSTRDSPKSITRGPSGPSSTLWGLRSRCTIPARWMAVRALAVLTASRSSAPPRIGPSRATRRFSASPGTYSLTRYGLSPATSASRNWAVQNRATCLATSASRTNRARAVSSSSNWTRSSLTATRCPSAPSPR